MFGNIGKCSVPHFLTELEARWTDSNKHFNDVHADLIASLEAEKVDLHSQAHFRRIH